MKVKEIRSKFLNFFEERGHKLYDSAPLIPEDKSLLFTVAGMVPFKRFFLGLEKPSYKRATSSQVCIRTSDIDIIGSSPRHLTTFEMLGNFSFGDYFKKEAIAFGFELITQELGIDKSKIIATVYKEDNEAYEIWKTYLPEHQIHKLGRDTNFWEVGLNGPCGPCSEVYFAFNGVDNFDPDSNDFIEIYNMVFMSYNKTEEGLIPLPQKNVDTGMGLERVAFVLQGVENVFEIDSIKNIKKIMPDREESNIIVDHIKSACFLINDNIVPSNEKQGYVLRRLVRRAMKYAYELNIDILELVPLLKKEYPVLEVEKINSVLSVEKEKFLLVLEKGIKELEEAICRKDLTPEYVFKLYDTYGFPVELTEEIASKHGLCVDREAFEKSFNKHKELSRKNANFGVTESSDSDLVELAKSNKTKFIGYENLSSESTLLYHKKEGDLLKMVFDITPFYAESGGQVSDRGVIKSSNFKGDVVDVQKVSGLYVHFVKPSGVLDDKFTLHVDESFRNSVKANHSATHLLHSAARSILGDVKQAGSLVDDKRLRLDLTISRAITKSELIEIEDLVNREIFKNSNVCLSISTLEEAKSRGVIAFFEDRYGDKVRVVSISDFSAELCGGTHVSSTGEIGLFKIVSEKAISSGVRRIEAVTRSEAIKVNRAIEDTLNNIGNLVKAPSNSILEKVNKIVEESSKLSSDNTRLSLKLLDFILSNTEVINRSINIRKVVLDDNLLNLLNKKEIDGILFAFSKSGNVLVKNSSNFDISILREIFGKAGFKGGGSKKMFRARVDNIEKLENIFNTFIENIN